MAGFYSASYNSWYSPRWPDTSSERSSETSDDISDEDTSYDDTSYDTWHDTPYDTSYDTWHDTPYEYDLPYRTPYDTSYSTWSEPSSNRSSETFDDDTSYSTWHDTPYDSSYSTSYNSHGKKYEVPRRRVFSLDELQRGDHIAFHRLNGVLWHHAIVEDIVFWKGEIKVIEFTNTAKGFIEDNFIPPKTPRIAKVAKGTYKFRDNEVFLMLHKQCLDPESVVLNARRELGKGNYNPLTNNCEHFAMRCKTGKSSSDQVNKAGEMVSKEIGSKGTAFTEAAVVAKAGKVFVARGARVASKAGQRMLVREGTRLASKAGQGVLVREGTRVAARAGQGVLVREGTRVAARAGQGVLVREGTRVAARAGQAAIVRTGGDAVSLGVWGQTVSAAGQGVATSSTSAIAPIGGVVCAAVTEGLFMLNDISSAHADMQAGRINQREYCEVTGKRIVTGTSNIAGTTVGATIGQALIPVPILGGVAGGIFGGLAGSFIGNIIANS